MKLPIRLPGQDGPALRRLRILCYVLAGAVFITPCVQFVVTTAGNVNDLKRWHDLREAGEIPRDATPPKFTKGAIGRWRYAIEHFWQGDNIYTHPVNPRATGGMVYARDDFGPLGTNLHPNMPVTVVLLTPTTWMGPVTTAGVWCALKLMAIAAVLAMLPGIFRHEGFKLADWVIGVALLWHVMPIVADIQHGNTNVFVLLSLAAHLWLYRRGKDAWAGAALAVAVCLKLTPALFGVYWLYQRNWKLLAGLAGGLVVGMVAVPSLAVGPQHAYELTRTWLDNIIFPALLRGMWHPVHINQSWPAIVARYFLSGPQGDIFWDPEANPFYEGPYHGWITLVELSPAMAKWIVRAGQVAFLAVCGWAVGWRKLARDDGRRGLHFAMVLLGMMLLNQRTWDHHGAVMILAGVGIWQAIAFGRIPSRRRKIAFAIVMLAGPLVWLGGTDVPELAAKLAGKADKTVMGGMKTGEYWADLVKAYGPTFYFHVLLLSATLVLARSLKGRAEPYARVRQKLSDGLDADAGAG